MDIPLERDTPARRTVRRHAGLIVDRCLFGVLLLQWRIFFSSFSFLGITYLFGSGNTDGRWHCEYHRGSSYSGRVARRSIHGALVVSIYPAWSSQPVTDRERCGIILISLFCLEVAARYNILMSNKFHGNLFLGQTREFTSMISCYDPPIFHGPVKTSCSKGASLTRFPDIPKQVVHVLCSASVFLFPPNAARQLCAYRSNAKTL